MSKAPPLDIASEGNCLSFKVRRAARALGQRYDAALAPHALTHPQFSLLSVLASLGLRSLGELAAVSTTDRTTLTRNLGLLERQGLVEGRPGRDKRTRRFVLTPKGRKLQAAAKPAWLEVQTEMHGLLGKARFERLHADLDVLLARLRPEDGSPRGG